MADWLCGYGISTQLPSPGAPDTYSSLSLSCASGLSTWREFSSGEPNHPVFWILLSSLTNEKNQGSERLSEFPQVTQLARSETLLPGVQVAEIIEKIIQGMGTG